MRVGDHDGAVEKARIFQPCGARHFSVAVEGEPTAEDGVIGPVSAGKNGSDAGADRTFSNFKFAAAGDERGVSHFYALDVGDGVVCAGRSVEGDAQITGPRLGLGLD